MYAEMKGAVDIVEYVSRYTKLKQYTATEYVGLCPLHHEKTPSFHVYSHNQSYYCFGCECGGDILNFIEHYHNIPFKDALKVLEYESGVIPEDESVLLKEAKKFAIKDEKKQERVYLLDNCMDEFPASHDIKEWKEEGIHLDVLSKYNVRYNKEKTKIFFPIWDIQNRIVTIKFRDLFNKPKYRYVNKIGYKDFLYNMNFAKQAIIDSSECIVFEGEKSVMKMESWGIHNSVAAGNHFLKGEIEELIKLPFDNVVFAYDQDVSVEDIVRQSNVLRHYKNVYYVPTYKLPQKMAPCDEGFDCWKKLYESRVKLK